MKNNLLTKYALFAQPHEDIMLQKIVSDTRNIAESIEKYGCTLEIIREWNNDQDKITSDTRLPIKFGYQCWISCLVVRNGKALIIPANDGEADYYECSSCFTTSLVTKSFFHLRLILNSDYSEILNELISFLDMLSKGEV